MPETLEAEIVTTDLGRECATCHEVRPADAFKDATAGSEFASCRKCRQGSGEHSEMARALAAKLAAEARGDYINSPHVTELNAEMFRLFDGVKGCAQAWFDQIQLAMVTRPGSAMVLKQFAEIAKLAKVATEHRDSAPDVARLTDEELGAEMLTLAMNVAKHLELEQ